VTNKRRSADVTSTFLSVGKPAAPHSLCFRGEYVVVRRVENGWSICLAVFIERFPHGHNIDYLAERVIQRTGIKENETQGGCLQAAFKLRANKM